MSYNNYTSQVPYQLMPNCPLQGGTTDLHIITPVRDCKETKDPHNTLWCDIAGTEDLYNVPLH